MRPFRLKADDFLCASAAALAALVLNLSFLSKGYVLEGMARAIPIELGRFHSIFYGNYILYGFVGDCFHHLLKAFGCSGLAVDSLIMMDAFIGAGGIFVFFLILRALRADYFSAFAWCAVLAFTFGYWHWSTEAEDYIFSTFLLTLNFLFLLLYYLEAMPRSPVFMGFLYALAVMGHIVNAIFAPVGLWFLYCSHPKSWKGPLLRSASAFAVSISAVYAFVLLFIALLFLGSQSWPAAQGKLRSFAPRALAAAFAASLCLGNLGAEIYPLSFASNNPRLMHMAFLKAHTPPGAWVAGEGGEEINIPYFAERNPIQVASYRENLPGLRRVLDGLLLNGQRVFVTAGVREDSTLRNLLKAYRPALTAVGPDGFACYELRRPG